MRKILHGFGGLALLTLAGCDTIAEPRDPLTGQRWHLVEIERPSQRPVLLRDSESDEHWVRFESGGRFVAGLDCNDGNGSWYRPGSGSYGASQGLIEIGDIASTRARCPTPSYGEEMAASLPLASAYEIYDGGRTLLIRTRIASYRFDAR